MRDEGMRNDGMRNEEWGMRNGEWGWGWGWGWGWVRHWGGGVLIMTGTVMLG